MKAAPETHEKKANADSRIVFLSAHIMSMMTRAASSIKEVPERRSTVRPMPAITGSTARLM